MSILDRSGQIKLWTSSNSRTQLQL